MKTVLELVEDIERAANRLGNVLRSNEVGLASWYAVLGRAWDELDKANKALTDLREKEWTK